MLNQSRTVAQLNVFGESPSKLSVKATDKPTKRTNGSPTKTHQQHQKVKTES